LASECLDQSPYGTAAFATLATWEETSNPINRFPDNPRLPDNRGFFIALPLNGGAWKGKYMNAKSRQLRDSFLPERRLVRELPAPAPLRVVQENRFEEVKARLLSERLDKLPVPEWNSHVRRAANEAAALAWVTPYPLLVFPVLFEEKARATLLQATHQREVRRRTRHLLAA
jgi:hypothetical protein